MRRRTNGEQEEQQEQAKQEEQDGELYDLEVSQGAGGSRKADRPAHALRIDKTAYSAFLEAPHLSNNPMMLYRIWRGSEVSISLLFPFERDNPRYRNAISTQAITVTPYISHVCILAFSLEFAICFSIGKQ